MRARCYAGVDAFNARAGVPISLLALYGSTKTASDNLLVLLYNGAITYGEFAKKRQDIHDASVTAEAQINEELAKQSADAQARASQLAMQAQQTNLAEIQTRQMQTQTQLMGLQTINQSIQTQNQQRFMNQQNQNQQALINQLNRPTTTNCSRYGNSVNCTSW
jgi:succinate dehydrogenase/fumarate reductase flavoprotein subunit